MDNLFNKVSYNTYEKVLNTSNALVVGAQIINFINYLTIKDPTLATILNSVSCTNMLFFSYNVLSKNNTKTKEIVYIEKLYNEIIKDFNRLNKLFNFIDPNEIFSLYAYALHNGYLSKGKKYTHDSTISFDKITKLYGVNIMTGKAVCRHNSAMLRDIYNDLCYQSLSLSVFTDQNINLFYDMASGTCNNDLYKKNLNDLVNGKSIEEVFFELIKEKSYLLEVLDELRISNHALTEVIYDGKGYFFDSTNESILKMSNGYLFDENGSVLSLSIKRTKRHNSKTETKNIIEKLFLPETTYKEDLVKIEKAKKVYDDNKDLLEKFYLENHEKYEEIDNILSKINKKVLKKTN